MKICYFEKYIDQELVWHTLAVASETKQNKKQHHDPPAQIHTIEVLNQNADAFTPLSWMHTGNKY